MNKNSRYVTYVALLALLSVPDACMNGMIDIGNGTDQISVAGHPERNRATAATAI